MIFGKTVFVTGGAGFIGSSLVGRLLEHNTVVVFDDFTHDSLRGTPYRHHANLSVVEGDVLNLPRLRQAMAGANVVVHCAAIVGVNAVMDHPTQTMRVNMSGSANVLEAASSLTECERVVCFSTSEVFGVHAFNAQETDSAVTGAVGEARWSYAVSKLAEEHLAIAYHSEFGLPATVVRPFNVYGPGQSDQFALGIFIRRALEGAPLEIHGDGTQIRAWCYRDDLLDGVLLAMEHPAAVGESFNIGNSRAVETIYGLANTVIRVLGATSEIVFVRKDYQDIELRVPSVRKAQDMLGYEAKVDLEEGIRRTAEHYGWQRG